MWSGQGSNDSQMGQGSQAPSASGFANNQPFLAGGGSGQTDLNQNGRLLMHQNSQNAATSGMVHSNSNPNMLSAASHPNISLNPLAVGPSAVRSQTFHFSSRQNCPQPDSTMETTDITPQTTDPIHWQSHFPQSTSFQSAGSSSIANSPNPEPLTFKATPHTCTPHTGLSPREVTFTGMPQYFTPPQPLVHTLLLSILFP